MSEPEELKSVTPEPKFAPLLQVALTFPCPLSSSLPLACLAFSLQLVFCLYKALCGQGLLKSYLWAHNRCVMAKPVH